MDFDQLSRDLLRDEGCELKPYRCTAGALSLGIGRNLDANGISRDEALYMLDNDIRKVTRELYDAFPWYSGLPEASQRALCNMAFNLGLPRLRGFRELLAALEAGEWEVAGREALGSLWARQVGQRAHRIADLFRQGWQA